MKLMVNSFVTVLLLCLFLTSFTSAQTPGRDPVKEAPLIEQLQKKSPKAVDAFKAATIALDQGNYQESIRLYNEVLAQAPDFDPAQRRLGFALIGDGKRSEGLAMTQKALSQSRTPDNLFGQAFALTSAGKNDYQPSQSDYEQALALSKEAIQKDTTNDSDYVVAAAEYSMASNNFPEFDSAVRILREKYPNLAATHYFNGLSLADAGNLDAAEAEIKQAESMGLPHEDAQKILSAIETEKDNNYYWVWKYVRGGLYLIGAWILGLGVLFAAGKALSAKTLRSIENSDPNDITGGGQAGLRKIYKNLISIAGIYYYLSQPIVMLLVIAAAGGITILFLYIGTIPIKLLLIVGFVALATVFYMVKSLLVRTKPQDPGRALTKDEAPQLWALVNDVAKTIDTRPADEIRITYGAELAVYERGGVRARMQDKADRILIIGVAALNGFSQNAFRAVLAHEYGHFSNRDTAGGTVAMRVNNDIIRLAESMALSGTATVYNIAFHFLRFYHFLFRRITHGASRLQEILADRVAVHQYGAEAFREGLTHVIRRDIEFNHVANKEINAAFSSKRALQNLYELSELDESIIKDLEQQYNENISRPTTEDDSHPSPEDRFKLANQIKSKECAPLSGMVWDLFTDKEALTTEMNASLETNLKAKIA